MEERSAGWEQAYAEHGGSALWSEDPIPCLEELMDELVERGCRTVLDVGCGDGRNLESLVRRGLHGTGLDLSPSALRKAAARLGGRALLLLGDARELTMVPDATLDAVTCLDVFGQVADTAGMIAGFRRILRPGGVLAFNAFTLDDSEYGRGTEIGRHTFDYRGTLFRFYEEDDVRRLLSDWRVEQLARRSWVDPPHGDFRPHAHTHDNWIVIASRT